MRAFLALAALALRASSASLSEEALTFLDRLASQGYEGIWMQPLELDLLEPCTLEVFINPLADSGFIMAMGGPCTLDLYLEACGRGWSLADSLPDDLPVLELRAPLFATLDRVVIRAEDMIRGAGSDSAVVMYAVTAVDRVVEPGDVPADQDSTGVQE